jgi:hypothetical protein
MHYHSCPSCYEHVPCDLSCFIEPDLQDGDKEHGAHLTCKECKDRPLSSTGLPLYSKEWWDEYNGFSKRKLHVG